MTLSAAEFIRRFLLHVLPKGFRRIRHYGLLGKRNKTKKPALCKQLTNTPIRPKEKIPDLQSFTNSREAEGCKVLPPKNFSKRSCL